MYDKCSNSDYVNACLALANVGMVCQYFLDV